MQTLIDALRNKRIKGAALDVFEEEPLQADHPLFEAQFLDNVLISAHTADVTPDFGMLSFDVFLKNLARFVRSEPLLTLVDKTNQY